MGLTQGATPIFILQLLKVIKAYERALTKQNLPMFTQVVKKKILPEIFIFRENHQKKFWAWRRARFCQILIEHDMSLPERCKITETDIVTYKESRNRCLKMLTF